MNKLAPLSVVALMLAGAANAERYDCEIDTGYSLGWVSEQMRFGVDRKTGAAWALDGIIYNTNDKKPMTVSLVSETDQALRLKWEMRNLPTSDGLGNGPAGVMPWAGYSIVYNKKSRRVSVKVQMPNNDLRPRADGTCVAVN